MLGGDRMPTLGTRIRWAMEHRNLSKMYVSQQTGITTYKLAKMMKDDIQPRSGELKKLSRLVGVELG